MHSTRKMKEEKAALPQQPKADARTLPRELVSPRPTPLLKALSIQNLTQIERPWENVTLNRCLFVAITILVLTSGCQRLHETLRGQRTAKEEEEPVGLTARRSGSLRHRGSPPQPETTLWEVLLWWLPDLDDEDDEDEEEAGVKRRRLNSGASAQRGLRGLKNKPMVDRNLMKQRGGNLKTRRCKRGKEEENRRQDQSEDAGQEDVSSKKRQLEEKKEKKNTQKP